MPQTREEHVIYTREELSNYEYYINVINILKRENIKSYVDVGANVGEFCNYLFEKVETLSSAYLIEPERGNYKFMLDNIVCKDKIVTINSAIGYNIKNATLVSYDGNVGGFKVVETQNSTSIDIKTLEEINLPIVDLVKIDVEGFEYNIIENSKYLQSIKFIEIEFHDYQSKSIRDYISKYFPNHSIIEFEKLEGRFLLKMNKSNE